MRAHEILGTADLEQADRDQHVWRQLIAQLEHTGSPHSNSVLKITRPLAMCGVRLLEG